MRVLTSLRQCATRQKELPYQILYVMLTLTMPCSRLARPDSPTFLDRAFDTTGVHTLQHPVFADVL